METKIKAIIWDLDGTLIDSDLYIACNYAHMYHKFGSDKYPPLRKILTFSGPSSFDVLQEEFPDVPIEKTLKEFLSFSKKHEYELLSLYEGEVDCLETFHNLNIIQCVLTNKKKIAAKNDLEHLNMINKYIDFIIGLDDVTKPKPDPEGIYMCLNKMNVKKEEAIIIGDSITDIKAGKNASILTGLVDWSLKGKQNIDADYKFDSFKQIKELIIYGNHN